MMRGSFRPARAGRPAGIDEQFFLAAILLSVVGVPLAMGGRHPLGQAMLTAAAALAVIGLLWRRFSPALAIADGRTSGARIGVIEVLAAAALLVGCAQLVPVPHRFLQAVSSQYDALLPLFSGQPGQAGFGAWDRISLVPGETIVGLGIFLAQTVLVVAVAQRMREVENVERLLTVLAGSTAALALLGIAQYIGGNGRFLWLYDHVYVDAGGVVKGTFSNRNHYANFLAMGVGAVLWWALHPERGSAASQRAPRGRAGWAPAAATAEWREQWRGGLGLLGVAIVVFAGLSSLSRGGAIALAAALLVALAALAASGVVRTAVAASLAGAGLLAVAALQIHGLDRLTGRLDDLLDAAFFDDGFSRLEVWKAACRAIADFPWLGTGIGSHADVSPIYMPATGSTIYTHAENSYLNLGVETGLVGLGMGVTAVLVGLVACGIVAWRGSNRERAASAALAAGLVASAVHAAGDFVWYVPACSTVAMLCGASAVAMASRHVGLLAPMTLRLDRASAVIVAGFFAILLGGSGARQLAAARAEPEWETAIRESRKLAAASGEAADDEAVAAGLGRVVGALERVVRLRPEHPRGWAMLATARLERFGLGRRLAGTEATLVDLREAASAAGFTSRDQVAAWLRSIAPADGGQLELAVEEARRAVCVCPLAGDAWCVLAALAFLDAPDEAVSAARIEQAVLVRPTDGRVLFEAGSAAALQDDMPRAVEWWRKSFATGPEMRRHILGILAGMRVSPREVCDLLEPDLEGMRAIDAAWSRLATVEEMREVRSRRLDAVLVAIAEGRTGGQRGTLTQLYIEAASLQRGLGDMEAAGSSLDEALHADPGSYPAHLARAEHAIAVADWETARAEIEWCLLRRPENRQLHDKLKAISRAQADAGDGASPRASHRTATRP